MASPILGSVEELVAEAQMQRQDFLAAQANVKAKEASLTQAKRAVFPTLSTQLSSGRYVFEMGLAEPENHWTAVLTMTFPLFQGYYYKNQIRNAEANVELSKAELLQTELSLIQNVTTAHMGVKTAASNLTDSEEYLLAAEMQFDISITSYKAGTMTILDVLQAQSSLANARSQKAEAEKNWFLSLAQIAYATGSLCATPNEEKCRNGS